MILKRSSGMLMHISSLPGKHGIGTLGDEAYTFADQLNRGGQSYWQILPFHPVSPHFGYSPYATASTFAGNKYFINFEKLKKYDWINNVSIPDFNFDINSNFINFKNVTEFMNISFKNIFNDYLKCKDQNFKNSFKFFCDENQDWLDDYVLYCSLVEHYNSFYWPEWDKSIALREKEAINYWNNKLIDKLNYFKFIQFLFFTQWREWKDYCNQKNIKIIGDIPIYISIDSADAWANADIFQLDKETRKPLAVAGVPPDYFSETGQLWGNPLYKWHDKAGNLNQNVMEWWISRLKHISKYVDVVRIDHFRSFDAYWSVSAEEKTAINGFWVKGPGKEFFKQVNNILGEQPIIAEDLGLITPEVEELRDYFNFPGMKILQFAFDLNKKNSYLPYNIKNTNCILYTGTHDNNTTNGWYYEGDISKEQKEYIRKYLNSKNNDDFHKKLIRLGLSSVANLFIFPVQDLLGYSAKFRMNTPGTMGKNWLWKLTPGQLTDELLVELRELTDLYGRI